MRDARSEEYRALVAEITDRAEDADRRTVTRWRRALRRIDRRDYFRSPGRDRARLEIERVASAHPALEAQR